MDRFIATHPHFTINTKKNLKSSMDRFIVVIQIQTDLIIQSFKIQYG